MKLPMCPQSAQEFNSLVYAFSETKFDHTLQVYQGQVEEIVQDLLRRGKSPTDVNLYKRIISADNDEHERLRAEILKWGATRLEGARNFLIHFNSPCYPCRILYAENVTDIAIDLAEEDRVDLKADPKRVQEYLETAHQTYLGKLEGQLNDNRMEFHIAQRN